METENSAVTTGPTGIHVKLIRGDVGMFNVRLPGHLFVKQSVPQDFCCSNMFAYVSSWCIEEMQTLVYCDMPYSLLFL